MLPILRVLHANCVLLAIAILGLALSPPDGSRSNFAPRATSARGALIARADHPEWRQFRMLTAIRRADEIGRLHDLPDRPTRTETAPSPGMVAELPDKSRKSDTHDSAGAMPADLGAVLPLDVGETSSFELPISQTPAQPPIIRLQRQPPRESETTTPEIGRLRARYVRHLKPPFKRPGQVDPANWFTPSTSPPERVRKRF
jgi:hypothetical protein